MKIINTEESKGFQPIRLTIEIETKEELLDLYARVYSSKSRFNEFLYKKHINDDEMVLVSHLKELAKPFL